MSDHRARYVFGALAVEQALDVLTTKYAMSLGATEGNPVAAPFVHHRTLLLLGVKVLPVLLPLRGQQRNASDRLEDQRSGSGGPYVKTIDVLDQPDTVRGDDLYQRRLHGLDQDEDCDREDDEA